jgi:intracellular multiplication protein IcmL
MPKRFEDTPMSNELQPMEPANNDALVLIHLRNSFYRQRYRQLVGIFALCLFVIAGLVVTIVYLERHPAEPLFFAADSVGKLIPDVPLGVRNLSSQEVSSWAIKAVEAAYSYDYVNYRSQLQSAQQYFNAAAWRGYMSGLSDSNNLVALLARKYIVISKVVDMPILIKEGPLGGAYAWKYKMQLLVNYFIPPYSEQTKFSNALIVDVIVRRANLLQSSSGLEVVQLVSQFNSGVAPK